jgi:hypothetical protein
MVQRALEEVRSKFGDAGFVSAALTGGCSASNARDRLGLKYIVPVPLEILGLWGKPTGNLDCMTLKGV